MKALIALALVLSAAPALAQEAPATTGNSSATGSAQAANNVTVVADAGRYAPADTSVKYSGHTWTTPNVGGSYFAGANGCLVGSGGGAAGGPIAFNFTSGRNDPSCNRRNDAAAMHSLGLDGAAIARMCQGVETADAFFATTGMACPGTNKDGRYTLANGEPAPVMDLSGLNSALRPKIPDEK